MRALFVVVALAASLLTTLPTAAFAQETLTNQSIMEMVKAGLSERVVIAKIRTSPTSFDTSTDALIALKKNGVSVLVSKLVGLVRIFAMTTRSESPALTISMID